MRELWREFEAARQRRDDDYQQTLILAWHVAAFERQNKLPDLNALLNVTKKSVAPAVKPTMAQQKAQLLMLSEFLGQPVKAAKPKKRHG